MTARRATADERARLWPRIVETYDGYAKYQEKAPARDPARSARSRLARGDAFVDELRDHVEIGRLVTW